MQADLAKDFAEQFELELIRFRYFDCVVFGRGEVQKLFAARSKRILGCGPRDRMVTGELLFAPSRDIKPLRKPSPKFEWPNSGFGCGIANFPWLITHALIDNGTISPSFVEGLQALFDQLPDTLAGWREAFGEGFLDRSGIDRIRPIVARLSPNFPAQPGSQPRRRRARSRTTPG